jgi:DNA-binding response OmpR family regulator
MTKILLGLNDESLAARVASALESGRYELTPLSVCQPDDFKAMARTIIESNSDVAILDYWSEENTSVKLMQTVSEVVALNHPAFIFIEGPGSQASREEVLMALNEGGHAFLTADFQPAALSNYVERALVGPGRLRPRARDPHETDVTIQILEEALGQIRSRSLGFQKVIGHLLATPFSAQNRKVLVVSDSSYQLEMLKKTLEDHNFQVLTAGNPLDGLNVAINDGPRIIVSDLELEGQTGLEFCQAVKFTHKIGPCYFVICTANQKKLAKVMTPGNGVDDCLLKPSGAYDNLEFVSRVAMGLLL